MPPFSYRLKKYMRPRHPHVNVELAISLAEEIEVTSVTPSKILKDLASYRSPDGCGVFGNLAMSSAILDQVKADLIAGKIPEYNYMGRGGRPAGSPNNRKTPLELFYLRENRKLKARNAELEGLLASHGIAG